MLSVHATPKNESNQGLCATHQPSATCECNEGSTPHTHKDSVLGRSVQLCVCVCFSKKFPRYELGVSARCIRCLERKHHRIDNSMHNLTSNIFALAVGCNFTLRKHIRKNTQCLCVCECLRVKQTGVLYSKYESFCVLCRFCRFSFRRRKLVRMEKRGHYGAEIKLLFVHPLGTGHLFLMVDRARDEVESNQTIPHHLNYFGIVRKLKVENTLSTIYAKGFCQLSPNMQNAWKLYH